MPPARASFSDEPSYEVRFGQDPEIQTNRQYSSSGKRRESDQQQQRGPVDLDELFASGAHLHDEDEDGSLFDEQLESDDDDYYEGSGRFFAGNRRLLDNDASLIPGSPFSKPMNRVSNRPSEPLALAKYASLLAFAVTLGWVGFLFFVAVWNYTNIGRIVVECLLAVLAFFGLFWNSYFIVSSIFKCFIPARAFKTNTKYCSIVPERKPRETPWLDVTIQIPVYKEDLQEVMMPTLDSCMKARDNYLKTTGARCNIVVCDDGLMNYLRDNFAAAEMLWENICKTQGRVIRLSKLLKRVPVSS